MSSKLESYLEEIGHYLAGREEREEILSEIRGHILEKAELEHGAVSEVSLDKVISEYGSPRRVAEKYLEGDQIIAPAYKRYLVRYTSLLFAFHTLLVIGGFLGKKSVSFFPIFVPRMTFFEALAYLPMAFVFDLGVVGIVLYLITRSRRDVRLPWPKLAVEPEKGKKGPAPAWRIIGFLAALAVTVAALVIYLKYDTLFFYSLNFGPETSIFAPEVARFYSLCLLVLLAVNAAVQFSKILIRSPWPDILKDGVSLAVVGLLFTNRFELPFAFKASANLERWFSINFTIVLIIIAVIVAVDLLKNLVAAGRRKIPGPGVPPAL
jgi:hypothetical protein